MPWVEFVKDYPPYKKGQRVDLPSYRKAFYLKNKGVLIRIDPPASAVKRAVRRVMGKK